MKDREPVYLGGEVNRVACEPLWETELRETRQRMKPNQLRHAENLAIFTGRIGKLYYENGVLRNGRGRNRFKSTQDVGVNKNP